VISRFLKAYQEKTDMTVFGDGMQSRDFIYVSDVAKANTFALLSPYAGVLNIATGVPQTLLDIIAYLEAAGTEPANVVFAPERAGDIKASYAAVSLAKQHLGFQSSISLKDGLRKMLGVPR
jgi:UDP-glucose 4-epimerase